MRAMRTASLGAKIGLVGILLLGVLSAYGVDIKRPKEPVVVSASELALFLGAPPSEMFVYSLKNGAWQQICFQIDEKVGGTYFGGTNGQLDASDEICFMAADLGDSAANHQWINDAVSLTHQRYQIRAVNRAISPAKIGYAYIYRSSTLAIDGTVVDYMHYAPAPVSACNDTVKAKGYTLGHNSDGIPDYLVIKNGNVSSADILDRWKIRYQGKYFSNPSLIYQDNEISALSDSAKAVQNGRIRVIRKVDFSCRLRGFQISPLTMYTIFYPYHSINTLKQNNLQQIFGLDTLRQSWDFSSLVSGAQFHNSVNSNVVINGVPDIVDKDISEWQLIQGSMGSVVNVLDSLLLGSVKENYYKDDATPDMRDTGDGASFGDSGILIANTVNKLTGNLLYKTSQYYLGDTHTAAIGDSVVYLKYRPLEVSVMAREFVIPVELASFTAVVRDNGVELLWSTASESDNYGFEIQRFNTSNQSWSKIGWVKGAGTVVDAQHYRFFDQPDTPGMYQYRLKQIDHDGTSTLTVAVSAAIQSPTSLVLWPNYPNPFNPETQISFTLPSSASGPVRISIYNMLGQEIKVLFAGELTAGMHSYRWDGTDQHGRNSAGGVYFCRLQTVQGTKLQKLVKML